MGKRPNVHYGHRIGLQRMVISALLALAMLGAPAAGAQTFEEASAAYRRGDFAAAFESFRDLAKQGNADAQTLVGLMYDRGEGVPQDYIEAVSWYRQAAEQGHDLAQAKLGLMYLLGIAVPKDDIEAVRWVRWEAERGNDLAQFSLGVRYDEGKGVPQDYAEAMRWYRLAAEQGYDRAQAKLGLMYILGRGVLQDYVQAHKWLNLAASRFSSSERKLREEIVHYREEVAKKMTPAQIAEAQRLAGEWRPQAAIRLQEEE